MLRPSRNLPNLLRPSHVRPATALELSYKTKSSMHSALAFQEMGPAKLVKDEGTDPGNVRQEISDSRLKSTARPAGGHAPSASLVNRPTNKSSFGANLAGKLSLRR